MNDNVLYELALSETELDILRYILKNVDLNSAIGCFNFDYSNNWTYKEDFKTLLTKIGDIKYD